MRITLTLLLGLFTAGVFFGGIQKTTADEAVAINKLRRRPLLGVQRWDMFSGKGATQQKELWVSARRTGLSARLPMA